MKRGVPGLAYQTPFTMMLILLEVRPTLRQMAKVMGNDVLLDILDQIWWHDPYVTFGTDATTPQITYNEEDRPCLPSDSVIEWRSYDMLMQTERREMFAAKDYYHINFFNDLSGFVVNGSPYGWWKGNVRKGARTESDNHIPANSFYIYFHGGCILCFIALPDAYRFGEEIFYHSHRPIIPDYIEVNPTMNTCICYIGDAVCRTFYWGSRRSGDFELIEYDIETGIMIPTMSHSRLRNKSRAYIYNRSYIDTFQ